MDSVGVKMIVGLDGKRIEELLDCYQKKYPGRFLNFYNILMVSSRVSDEFLANLPSRLEEYVKNGGRGIGEFPKDLGLKMFDKSGKLIRMDDTRLDPFFAKAGELGIPIVWHAGDPTPFFKPINKHNERYIELRNYPQWSYAGPKFPTKEEILKQKENVIRKHPETIFIGAHMSWITDDLGYLASMLDKYPNFYVEIGSALSELGRQPFTSREFFIKYQDRILFGTDGGSLFNVDGWTVERFYRSHWEFLETDNEYIAYPMQGAINQGDWKIYGLNLPDEVLEKIYYKNAEKILNMIKQSDI
jgi:predicted TIM-barrel fold metal-dependent hydrolase